MDPSHPRYLTKLHDAQVRHAQRTTDQQRLYSFHAPSLTAGRRTISVSQEVTAPNNPSFTLTASQTFQVVAPRFHLPPTDLHAIYPPPGGTIASTTLPYMVFNDPHLPWERRPAAAASPSPGADERIRQPWLALWVFRPDELLLPLGEEILRGKSLSESGSVRLPCSQLLGAGMPTPLRTNALEPDEEQMEADFIFVPRALFHSFTRGYGPDGTPLEGLDLSPYGYLAHVRQVGGDILKSAAASMEDRFSVVMANRTGPGDNKTPVKAVAHLISLEGIDDTFSLADTDPFVALCSLHSWVFEYAVDDDQIKTPGNPIGNIDVLRPPSRTWAPLVASDNPVQQQVGKRLRDGYSLGRYRTLSGEETVAFYRGPLIPGLPPPNAALNAPIHLFASQLQILDAQVGLPDNSYMAAWNLGKANALADERFLEALVRLRSAIFRRALLSAKGSILQTEEDAPGAVWGRIHAAKDALLTLSGEAQDPTLKWRPITQQEEPGLGLWDPALRQSFQDAVAQEAAHRSQALTGDLYAEGDSPRSSDWAALLAWLLDALCLSRVPADLLLPEPQSLSPGSLRFFSLDPTWMNAYIDGALSVGNHVEGDQDSVRVAIKNNLQAFLDSTNPTLGYQPQIPTSGCLIRSPLVAHHPDLTIRAPRAAGDARAQVLQRLRLAPDVLLLLFDRPLTTTGFPEGIRIVPPPHEQSFVVTNGRMAGDTIEMVYRNIPTQQGTPPRECMAQIAVESRQKSCFVRPDGLVLASNVAHDVYDFLKSRPELKFTELAPSSAMLALHFAEALQEVYIPLPDPEPDHPGQDGFHITMLEMPDLHRLGDGYTQRQGYWKHKDAPPVSSLAEITSQNTTLRPPYWAKISTSAVEQPGGTVSPETSLPLPSESQYRLQIHALGYPVGEAKLPRDSTRPLSLVFALQRISDEQSYLLRQLQVHIPSGPDGLLGQGYRGPGATMANNIRFLPDIRNLPGEVIVTLSPRSKAPISTSPRSCETSMNRDLTFILREASLYAAGTAEHLFTVTVHEYYGESLEPVTSTAQVEL
ncbi:hypothetical protein ASPZODRAFT_20492 [Penicilliopsis zonata CBS 506.65]|uniref:Uncharacterized protein n=1 Tax=Penicilliopsis zonata CBS 506.65 TaxID=1073090 RepID=A0A1L9S5C8_9EURO|nr:hypothetical protein ASPZODRAFT_20492 [Penicilliopsis zonata CBS 506.65]OJJ42374.1 hypothetical protein ASPZODRAFT_20492 [Penicilliopsis zonata CBS 506.65]